MANTCHLLHGAKPAPEIVLDQSPTLHILTIIAVNYIHIYEQILSDKLVFLFFKIYLFEKKS